MGTPKTHASSAGGTYIYFGTFAARPVAGVINRYYYATDRDTLYRDTGAAWAIAGNARQVIVFQSPVNVAAGATRYFGTSRESGLEVAIQVPFAIAGTLRNLYVQSGNPPGAGETFTYTLRINGANGNLTAQIAGAVATQASDLVNTDAIAAGNRVCIRIVASGATAVTSHQVSMEFVPE